MIVNTRSTVFDPPYLPAGLLLPSEILPECRVLDSPQEGFSHTDSLPKAGRFPAKIRETAQIQPVIPNDMNPCKNRHSRESGNPGENWIPGQARNDKGDNINVVRYR
jgi:hypothetical protein